VRGVRLDDELRETPLLHRLASLGEVRLLTVQDHLQPQVHHAVLLDTHADRHVVPPGPTGRMGTRYATQVARLRTGARMDP